MLTSEEQPQLHRFLYAVAISPVSLLMLDYNGTLAPFHRKRDEAAPYPGVVPILQEIIRVGRTRLIIVSGRDADEMPTLLDLHPRPEVWGLHGLQRRKSDGSTEIPRLDDRVLDALSDADQWLISQQLQHTAESKFGTRAVHWRGLSGQESDDVRNRVLLGWKPIARHAGLDILEFDGGLEIRVSHRDKGDAVRALLREVEPNTPAAYLGDDLTDESAFRALENRGLSVLVRPKRRRTTAQMWIKPPEELFDFLNKWLEACRCRGYAEKALAVNR